MRKLSNDRNSPCFGIIDRKFVLSVKVGVVILFSNSWLESYRSNSLDDSYDQICIDCMFECSVYLSVVHDIFLGWLL